MAPYAFSDASRNVWISILGEEFDSQKYHRGIWIVRNRIIHSPPTTILDEYALESVCASRLHSPRDVGTVFLVVR